MAERPKGRSARSRHATRFQHFGKNAVCIQCGRLAAIEGDLQTRFPVPAVFRVSFCTGP